MKIKKTLSESLITFKKIDEVVSNAYLFYASTCGFIFGWVVIALLLFSANGSIPSVFVILLRVFYFLISFLIGLKLTIWGIECFKKRMS